jgi:hypothetical protein
MKSNNYNTIKKRIAKQKELFLIEFKKKAGNVSATAEAVGIDRWTYYNWYKTDKEFAKKADEIIYAIHEIAENQLMKNILAGKETSLIFYLCNRMPGRWKNVQRVEQRLDTTTEGKIDKLLSLFGQVLNGSKKDTD